MKKIFTLLLVICFTAGFAAIAYAAGKRQVVRVENHTDFPVYVFDWGYNPIWFLKRNPEQYIVMPHNRARDNEEAIVLRPAQYKKLEKGATLIVRFYDVKFINSIPERDLNEETLYLEERIYTLDDLIRDNFTITYTGADQAP